MKKMIAALVVISVLIAGCDGPAPQKDLQSSADDRVAERVIAAAAVQDAEKGVLPDTLVEIYYLSTKDPVHSYLQNKSILRFLNMWVKETMGEDVEAHWNYDTLAPVRLLDQDFQAVKEPDLGLYTCTFSTGDDRTGYIIISYGEAAEGPYISKWSLQESTPHEYDLRANESQIAAALEKTDINLSTASAARVERMETDTDRGDSIILFMDGKGDRYVCQFGDGDVMVEKQQAETP